MRPGWRRLWGFAYAGQSSMHGWESLAEKNHRPPIHEMRSTKFFPPTQTYAAFERAGLNIIKLKNKYPKETIYAEGAESFLA
jgi:hypothetical protein